uniref:Uncharacterized protein n=1 Tax=Caenorhabditis japonica TaxID=281687 RepID=A0A8R1HLZ9_CAEJA
MRHANLLVPIIFIYSFAANFLGFRCRVSLPIFVILRLLKCTSSKVRSLAVNQPTSRRVPCAQSLSTTIHTCQRFFSARTPCVLCVWRFSKSRVDRREDFSCLIAIYVVHVRCPTCRFLTEVPKSFVRSNYQLMDAIQTISKTDRVSFLKCVACDGCYHEKDMNICSKCSPFNAETNAQELLDNQSRIDQWSICSTCLLRDHIIKGHTYLRFQPLRIEMQRIENLRRIVIQQDVLHKAQRAFRERLDELVEDWVRWNGSHDAYFERFRLASDSLQQMRVFDKFMQQLAKQTEQIERLGDYVKTWSGELERSIASPEVTSLPRPITPLMTTFAAQELYYVENI